MLYEILKQMNLNVTTTSLINRKLDICIFIKCYKRELFNYHSHVTFEYLIRQLQIPTKMMSSITYIQLRNSVKRFF